MVVVAVAVAVNYITGRKPDGGGREGGLGEGVIDRETEKE